MKILLVDDESYKLKVLMQILISFQEISDSNITRVLDLNQAKQELLENYYDFMILDLNMPEVLGEDPKQTAGANFIDEIIEVDYYKKPLQIIILTEFSECETYFKGMDNKEGFSILKYDSTNLAWAKIIKSKIKYALICETQRGFKNINNLFDVAIITAVDIETKAIKKISESWQLKRFDGDPSYYYETNITLQNKLLHVVYAQQSEMGMPAAAVLTLKLIFHYHPKYVIMVGIAAGIDRKNHFGDIIIPEEVWNYSNGKYTTASDDSQGLLKLAPDPRLLPLNPEMRDLIAQKDYSNILFKIKQQYQGQKPDCDLNIISGPMACGSAVIANKEIVEKLVTTHSRKTVGLDMESYGVFYAANNMNAQKTIPICIKSICDFADNQKSDAYQDYAAYTSAEFTKFLVSNELDFNR